MLREIHIKNFAILKELFVSFDSGFNVLTGETGAGKSILIDALALSIGRRANSEHIKSGETSATISSAFDNIRSLTKILNDSGITISESEPLIFKRIVSNVDKNRSFINQFPVSLSFIKNTSENLLDIHGQHQHQSLFDKNFRIEVIDEFGNLSILRKEMEVIFNKYIKLSSKIKKLKRDLEERKKEFDLNMYQYEELKTSNILKDEEIQLENEIRILTNAEKLKIRTQEISDKLYGSDFNLYSEFHSMRKNLVELIKIDKKLGDNMSLFEEIEILLSEISNSLIIYSQNIEISPERLKEANARLSVLNELQMKYGCRTNKDLLKLTKTLQEKLELYENEDEKLSDQKKHLNVLHKKLKELALKLSSKRKEVSADFEKLVVREFKELGLENGRFKVDFTFYQGSGSDKLDADIIDGFRINSQGIDEIDFLFSANPGEELKSLSKIASGGELSRIMLALKTNLAKVDKVGTLIFDEIDAGIGGKVATAVGKRLKKLSKNHQVLVVTHLPQIASFADNHIKVEKFEVENSTTIRIKKLDKEELRIQEITRMLSGDLKSSSSYNHAKELLESGKDFISKRN